MSDRRVHNAPRKRAENKQWEYWDVVASYWLDDNRTSQRRKVERRVNDFTTSLYEPINRDIPLSEQKRHIKYLMKYEEKRKGSDRRVGE